MTLADFSPLSFSIHSDYLQIEGYVPQPHEWMEISRAIVGPNYFRTLRTSVISGREFTEADTVDSHSLPSSTKPLSIAIGRVKVLSASR